MLWTIAGPHLSRTLASCILFPQISPASTLRNSDPRTLYVCFDHNRQNCKKSTFVICTLTCILLIKSALKTPTSQAPDISCFQNITFLLCIIESDLEQRPSHSSIIYCNLVVYCTFTGCSVPSISRSGPLKDGAYPDTSF